jgi:aminoglycoside phosphotransferase
MRWSAVDPARQDAGMNSPLAVGGNRLRWEDLPADLQDAVVEAAGAPVRAAASQPGGFSPGMASVLHLIDGRSVFVKAVSEAHNPDSPGLHRREAEVLAALPDEVPAPRLLWSFDDGDWVALMTEAVDGVTPEQPWRAEELDAFLRAAARLVEVLTPTPVPAPPAADHFAGSFRGWRRLAAGSAGTHRLDRWARRRLDRLAAIEESWHEAAAGKSLLHADLRADNVLLTRAGAVVVDWPHACVGASWADLLLALPSIAMHGGGDPQQLWDRYPPGRAADPDAVTAVLTAAAGYFLWQGSQPPPPGLPRVRAFQLAQGEVALRWLRQRLSGR